MCERGGDGRSEKEVGSSSWHCEGIGHGSAASATGEEAPQIEERATTTTW
jgi:hypothetical protein